MSMNLKETVLIGSFLLVVTFPLATSAEQASQEDTRGVDTQGVQSSAVARFMLKTDSASDAPARQLGVEDFSWNALAKNRIASGRDPLIGEGSNKAYYDFRDGNTYPFYIVPTE